MLRIITGTARGRSLVAPPGEATRPTAEKVKEAMFSAIQFEIEGRRVLDLFAGSGQLGLEALSRGASYATFVDVARRPAAVIEENLRRTGFVDRAQVLCRPAEAALAALKEPVGLVFLDPPYALGAIPPLLPLLLPCLAPGAVVVCEHDAEQPLPPRFGPFCAAPRRYGRTGVTIYRAEGGERQMVTPVRP